MGEWKARHYVRNQLEAAVNERFLNLVQREEVCVCRQCAHDMVAFVLNRLSPDYTAVSQEESLAQDEQLVYRLVPLSYQAIEKVTSNPRHSGEQIVSRDVEEWQVNVTNSREALVEAIVADLANDPEEICTCEDCLKYVYTVCLNQLPPKYCATAKGESYVRTDELDFGFYCELLVMVYRAFCDAYQKFHS